MTTLEQKTRVIVEASLTFDESELRALEALMGYGLDPFLQVFYDKMGKAYLKPHEKGLRSIFETLPSQIKPILLRAEAAHAIFRSSSQQCEQVIRDHQNRGVGHASNAQTAGVAGA